MPAGIVAVLFALLSSSVMAGQSPPTFRAATRLIIETVRVLDASGQPIDGLTVDDFTLTEDHVPQDIAFVDFQRLGDDTMAAGWPAPEEPRSRHGIGPVTNAQISPSSGRDGRYRHRRLIVLYFDLSAMSPSDQGRAYASARTFIDTRMTPTDLVAIMAFQSGAVRVRQDFTDDRISLREVIQTLTFGDDQDGDGLPDTVTESAAFGQNEAEFNIFNTDRQLAALQTAVNMLRVLPEQKALIYFSSGLRLTGTDNQAQFRATVNAAVRAHVTLNPIDARGLVAAAPMGDATRPSPAGSQIFGGRLDSGRRTLFERSQDTLYALAGDTGGRAMFDYNDLSLGIAQAAHALTSYYVLGYYSQNAEADGKFRRIRVTLRAGLSATIEHRHGYYADKAFGRMSASDKERQLEEALMLDDPITDIPMALEVNHFQLNRDEYFVPVAVKIPGSELALAKRRGTQRTTIDFIAEIKDRHGTTVRNLRDRLNVRLTDALAGELMSRPLQYQTGFTLLPDTYVIKLLARDATTGRIGTYHAEFIVPNLVREEVHLPISSVVVGSQVLPLQEAIYGVRQRVPTDAVDPLVYEGTRLLPSVTRVFSRRRDLHVHLHAYQHDAETERPLLAFISFYQGEAKVADAAPVSIGQRWTSSTKALPIRFSIALELLAAGRYDCQVTVIDPQGEKVAFWRAPIVVIP